jgi:alkanesulfonate monooxygenase SsuD/methylene tetrahydromethanopterin reductase-like flavin-dependent oxidoreductase (luciferase family)
VTFRLGAQILTYGSTWDEALETVQLLEELGYDYAWGHDQ